MAIAGSVLLSLLLLYQPSTRNFIFHLLYITHSFLISVWQILTGLGKKQPTSAIDQIIVGIVYTLLATFIVWIVSWIKKRFWTKTVERSDFPFRRIEAQKILAQISSFPEMETSYILRADNREASDLKSLADQSRILLIGRMGVGKTREAAELINLMDMPLGQALVIKPEKTLLGTSFEWPADIPLRQRRIILLLDNLNDFELYDENSDEVFQLKSNPSGFERSLIRLIKVFDEKCDDLRVIATLRLEIDEWKTIENRTNVDPWKEFHIYKLSPRTGSEAMSFTNALLAQIQNIELDYGAKQFLANRFDGTFASIRDFLRIKETSLKTGNSRVLLSRHDVEDFIGRYPADWETRFYKRRIEPNAAGKAIFEALGIITKAHIPPYENIVIGLAARSLVLGKRITWLQERHCRSTFQKLDLSIWITKRNS
jgi:hypothetical protein